MPPAPTRKVCTLLTISTVGENIEPLILILPTDVKSGRPSFPSEPVKKSIPASGFPERSSENSFEKGDCRWPGSSTQYRR